MKKYVRSAENEITAEDRLSDILSQLKSDFDYAIDGLDKMSADGSTDRAIEIASSLSEMINASVEEIAEEIVQED